MDIISVNQLKKIPFINLLKGYGFSLEGIKSISASENDVSEDTFFSSLKYKKKETEGKLAEPEHILSQLNRHILSLKRNIIMSYLEDINMEPTEQPLMQHFCVK